MLHAPYMNNPGWTMIEPLFVVGGSVRAAAMSARMAGFEPIAIDRFADTDLRRVCSQLRRYDELSQLPDLARHMPKADWMYTGPLENFPELIERLAEHRTLLGNSGATLRQLRDPWCLAAELRRSGLQSPELSRPGEAPAGNNWLIKPLSSAGGFGVERVDRATPDRADHSDTMYFQQLVSGRSIGATFLGAKGTAVLVGATEQLLGPAWGGSREFQYVGSVGPKALSPEHFQALTKIGECIAKRFHVRGLFGVDAIINDEGVWPVEVNPRYTASVEILERALNMATIHWHVAACRTGVLPELAVEKRWGETSERHGKAIVYASRELVIDTTLERKLCAKNGAGADAIVADIPAAGTNIRPGEPIVTVFAKGGTNPHVKERLQTAVAAMHQLCHSSVGGV